MGVDTTPKGRSMRAMRFDEDEGLLGTKNTILNNEDEMDRMLDRMDDEDGGSEGEEWTPPPPSSSARRLQAAGIITPRAFR
jgi:hypothetical protein